MGFSSGQSSISIEDILSKTTESDILSYYFKVAQVPTIINSPLRKDKNPSFGLYSLDGNKIYYKDFSTKESGGLFDLLSKLWGCDYKESLNRVLKDLPHFTQISHINKLDNSCKIVSSKTYSTETDLQCKIREWRNYDLEYWKSFGINLEWLRYAEVYPISHKIILKNNNRYVFRADKYAYAYVERKEGKITLKIYQPFNKNGYKWSNKHDNSVISLWTKVPEKGDKICICSSLKDALCLYANTNIPSLAVQGEGYNISNTAIKELKRRYEQIYILFDNDKAGMIDGIKLSESTGFTNIILPQINKAKDISDLYLSLQDKKQFQQIILSLFNNN